MPKLAICRPQAPMRRADDHALAGRRLDPSGCGAPAGKDQGMDVMTVHDRELEIAVVWRARNRLPNRGFAHRYQISAAAAP